MRVFLLSLALLFSSIKATAMDPAIPVVCQAMLVSAKQAVGAHSLETEDILLRLNTVRELIASGQGGHIKLGEIDRLIEDVQMPWSLGDFGVNMEIRGQNEVARYQTLLDSNLSGLDAQVAGILEEAFPRRRAVQAHLGAQAVVWGYLINGLFHSMNPELSTNFLGPEVAVYAFAVTSALLAYSDWAVPRMYRDSKFKVQVSTIRQCLENNCPAGSKASLVSPNPILVPAVFESNQMDPELAAVASVNAQAKPVESLIRRGLNFVGGQLTKLAELDQRVEEAAAQTRVAPRSPKRRISYKSLFYMDPKSHEPVVLILYLSTPEKDKPQKGKGSLQENERDLKAFGAARG